MMSSDEKHFVSDAQAIHQVQPVSDASKPQAAASQSTVQAVLLSALTTSDHLRHSVVSNKPRRKGACPLSQQKSFQTLWCKPNFNNS
jgi:hypothetical protein